MKTDKPTTPTVKSSIKDLEFENENFIAVMKYIKDNHDMEPFKHGERKVEGSFHHAASYGEENKLWVTFSVMVHHLLSIMLWIEPEGNKLKCTDIERIDILKDDWKSFIDNSLAILKNKD